MANVTEPWDEKAQIRHAAKVIWPSMFGRDEEYLRLCERLRELSYDGCIESMHYDSVIRAWRQNEWVLLSPDGMHVRLTQKGKDQFATWQEEERNWREGGNPNPVTTKQPVNPESVKIPPEVLAVLKNHNRDRDVRNAAIATWRHIIDHKGGQAPEGDFINSISFMVMKPPGRILEPVEILAEWKKAGWIEYSPSGAEIRITASGEEKLKEWEEEERRWKTGKGRTGTAAPQTSSEPTELNSLHLRFADPLLAEEVSKSKPPEGVKVSETSTSIEASAPAQIFSNVFVQFGLNVTASVLGAWLYACLSKKHANKSVQINRKAVVVTEEGIKGFINEQFLVMESLEKQQNEMTRGKEPRQLIQSLLDQVSALPYGDGVKLDALQKRARLIITTMFGNSSHYLNDLASIKFHGGAYHQRIKPGDAEKSWERGRAKFTTLCNTMLENIELNVHMTTSKKQSNRVFIVHGHDEAMKQAVARTLEQFGLEPVILHEQPDGGKTIIEKFVSYSDVGFAVVLLSPDDMGYLKADGQKAARPRARQNVVLELGFFLGKLGRERVLALHKVVPKFEMPSDYGAVLFKTFDDSGSWRLELARELKALEYDIDTSNLL